MAFVFLIRIRFLIRCEDTGVLYCIHESLWAVLHPVFSVCAEETSRRSLTMNLQQLVYQEIQTLPDSLLEELLDFIQFLKTNQTETTFLWEQVEETYIHRRQHPDKTTLATAEEWLADTADLDED